MDAIEILGMSMYDVPRMAEFTGRETSVDMAYMSMGEMSVADYISVHDVSVRSDSISARGLQEFSLDAMSLSLDEYVTVEIITRFAFDNRNNRISRTVTGDDESYVVAYTYDWNNRLLTKVRTGDSPSTTTFTYDRNGNQLTQTTGNNTKTLHYDVFNHLERVVQGNMTAAYTYRADGLRQSKTVNGHTTTHVWDRGSIILELNDSGTVMNRFSRGLGHLIHSYHHGFYLFNARTDVVQRVDSNGDILHTYRYDAFGNQLNGEETNTNPFRFSGEYYDWETGFIYLRARFMNSAIGRFISEDPYWTIHNMQFGNNPRRMNEHRSRYTIAPDAWVIMQAGNLFVFTANNPIRFIDPRGLALEEANGGNLNPPTTIVGTARDDSDTGLVVLALAGVGLIAWGGYKLIKTGNPQTMQTGMRKLSQAGQRKMQQLIPSIQASFESNKGHIFSANHVRRGIMNLGSSQTDIFNKILSEMSLFYSQIVGEGGFQIHTKINGIDTTIRFHVQNGEIIRINAFVGHATRVIGTLLE